MKRTGPLIKGSRALATLLALLCTGMGALHSCRVRSPGGVLLSVPKLLAGALAPFLALAGALSAILGALLGAPLALVGGAAGAVLSARYLRRVLAPHDGLARAFGADQADRAGQMLRRRRSVRLPRTAGPRWARDVPFWTLRTDQSVAASPHAPGSATEGADRQLGCDIWQPPEGVPPSGLAFVYLHGSGWHFADKDVGTRPMFRHLAAQGHTIMDVAYRLCPETDWRGMLDDTRHAVAWIKAHAAAYGVNPDRVVLAGGSAGGHLALLAAYTAQHPDLIPDDVRGLDLCVRGVVSWYGPTDMAVYYTHAGIPFGSPVSAGKQGLAGRLPERLAGALGFDLRPPAHWPPDVTIQEAMMGALLGGSPAEAPETYRLASPITYAGPGCPPTLLLQGEYDCITSALAVRALAQKLEAAGVPVVYVEYPQTEHAFDLILPQVSPAARAALYETDRFLALLA